MKFHRFADPSSVVLEKRSWSHLNFSSQQYENIFQALHKNFNCHSPLFSTWMNEKCLTIRICAIIGKEVAGHGTLAKTDRNDGFELKIARNGGFLPPPPLTTPTV